MKVNKNWWVGVLKGKWQNHAIFQFVGDPTPEDFPNYDYVIGPFESSILAKQRAAKEQNQTGMFTDPFGPQPYGR